MVVSNVLLVGLTEKLVCLSTGAPCICVLKGHNWVCGKNSLFQMAVAVLEKKSEGKHNLRSTASNFSK